MGRLTAPNLAVADLGCCFREANIIGFGDQINPSNIATPMWTSASTANA